MRLTLFISIFLLSVNLNFKSDDIIGYWQDESKELIVQCYKYSDKYYAKIKWFYNDPKSKQKFSEDGLPKSEWMNHVVMKNFHFNGSYWDNGKIYQIKYGDEYDAKIEMINKNEIVVRGFVLVSIFGQDVTFNRYFGDMPKQY
jgi:uncharacterized protein (DUF2147 family)